MAVWIIDEPMEDAQAEQAATRLAECDGVEVRTPDLGGAIVQLLLCASQEKPITLAPELSTLKAVFANVRFED